MMSNIFMIAKNNMKRQKGDMITFLIMTLISAFLLFNSLNAIVGVRKVLFDRYEAVNVPDYMYAACHDEEINRCLIEAFEKNGIKDYEVTPFLYTNCEYKNADSDEYQSFMFMLENAENDNRMLHVLDNVEKPEKGEILVPYNLQSAVAIGDTLELRIGDKVFDFKVKGYSENPIFCSNFTASMFYVYISPEDYEEMKALSSGSVTSSILDADLYKIIAEDKDVDFDKLHQNITNDYNNLIESYREANTSIDTTLLISIGRELVTFGNCMYPYIVVSMILSFAILILVIAFIITSFSITNFIQRNMKNTGILEACGYTVKELRNALTLQIVLVASVGVIIGVLLSLFTVPAMGVIFTTIMGLTWTQTVDPALATLTVLILLFIVFLIARILSGKYKKITVLDALRGGINTHNFKKNYFSFEKTNLPLSITLSLKDIFGNLRRNIAMILIIMVLTISALICFEMKENFGDGDGGTLLSVMGMEMGDAGFTCDEGHAEEIRKLPGVKNAYLYQSCELTFGCNDKTTTATTFAVDDCKYSINTVLIEGRQPENDNEIMLTYMLAKQLNAEVGDVVTLTSGDIRNDFVLTGTNQRLEMAGKTAVITLDGMEKLGARKAYDNYYVTAEEGVSYEELKKTLEDYGKDNDLEINCSDMKRFVSGILGSATSAMTGINVLISVLIACVVIFVESLIVRAKVTREWKGMGINKAMGMSFRDLLTQISLSNIPVVVAGCLLGGLSSAFAGRAFVKMIFMYMGIQKISFDIHVPIVIAVAASIILIAILTSAFEGLKVRKINPVEMISEE